MKYTSSNLSHFVGRSLKTDDEKYELLCLIVRGGKLRVNLTHADNARITTHLKYDGHNLGEPYEKIDCICFCDIPNEGLGIHTNKYSRFGVGFSREFLVNLGAHPVMYLPINTRKKQRITGDYTSIESYYAQLANDSTILNLFLMIYIQTLESKGCSIEKIFPQIDDKGNDVLRELMGGNIKKMLFNQHAALTEMIAFTKIFDPILADDDADNYYMEREWRILSDVEFLLNDIKTIYLPAEEYKSRFKCDFPSFEGNILILND